MLRQAINGLEEAWSDGRLSTAACGCSPRRSLSSADIVSMKGGCMCSRPVLRGNVAYIAVIPPPGGLQANYSRRGDSLPVARENNQVHQALRQSWGLFDLCGKR